MSLPSPSSPISWPGSYGVPMCHPNITSWPGSRAAGTLITAFLPEAHSIMAKGELFCRSRMARWSQGMQGFMGSGITSNELDFPPSLG